MEPKLVPLAGHVRQHLVVLPAEWRGGGRSHFLAGPLPPLPASVVVHEKELPLFFVFVLFFQSDHAYLRRAKRKSTYFLQEKEIHQVVRPRVGRRSDGGLWT
jgi:hypothetical protein